MWQFPNSKPRMSYHKPTIENYFWQDDTTIFALRSLNEETLEVQNGLFICFIYFMFYFLLRIW